MTLPRSPVNAAAFAIALALPLHAQISGGVGAFVGYYRPFGRFEPASVYRSDLPTRPSDLSGVAWGVVGQLHIDPRFGFETELAVARSTLPELVTPGGPRARAGAEVQIATLKARYRVSSRPARYHVWLSTGPALIRHGGDAYSGYGSPVSLGGALGVALVARLTPTLHFSADVTTLWYTFDLPMPPELSRNPGSLQHGAQRDALLHLGLRWSPFGHTRCVAR
jgi:hypothetical protein